MTLHRLKGVVAAVPTPLDSSFHPDLEAFTAHCRWALDNGCDALNVLGSTGEANSLSVVDRKAVMTAASRAFDGSKLMVGAATPDLATTVELTRYAHECGFAAALVLPPWYYKPVTDDGLYAWFARLVEETSATPIAIYLYNYPQLTGIRFSEDLARRLSASFPERIVGMKDSSGDLDYAAAMAKIDGFDVFPSNEAALANCDRDGYAGCISATVNIDPAGSAALLADQGNSDLLDSVRHVRTTVSSFPLVPSVKYLVAKRLGKASAAMPLPPFLPLTDAQQADLVEQIG
ncbi:dihydrodipicolinate synthase family protein [Hoeflea sp. WL0058]|uniref:Dihydrodipicolinate synthase family protein n=1 Tax=Flavimaribacter sediminis TaxID=2865987 RepID=A0AAE2ZJ92_9HYPH|nr:dihydrodipicolinate synthase family protein [Flavimaribacter sediminis]MBW8637774.1 dihydrodipicolinate synthase family protein [Flavimaribacter sediminis]